MSTLVHRLIGSAGLDAQSYEEVEANSGATFQAIGIVILSSLGAAIGTGIKSFEDTLTILGVAMATWFVWMFLTLLIGKWLLPGRLTNVNLGQLLRTTGFSATPGILRIFGIVPEVGWIIFLGATLWMLFSFVVAVRQALDYSSTTRALAVCLLGWVLHGGLLFGFVLIAQ